PMVQVGDTVELIGQRNEETAQLFGAGPLPAPGAQPATLTTVASAEQLPIAAPPAAQQATDSATWPSVFTTPATATLSGLMFAGSL
ncbi:MAG TPA: hypothetical protein VJX73_13065, partial [Terracidiphilus sp.]|nr:hypothetical protein [Terracidiphilus sp.]